MRFIGWFTSGDDSFGVPHAYLWAWVTIVLSVLVAVGYGVIAVNWYFQRKLSHQSESRIALARLRNLFLACAVLGVLFYLNDSRWMIWRCYDLVLLFLVFHTWSFVFRMRGLSLVDERLAQLDALEESANRYREIAELLPHMVWTATSAGGVDFSNQRWREYVGDRRAWVDAIHPDERQLVLSLWGEARRLRKPMSLEARLGGPTYRTFLIKATPIINGDAVKWLGACADIEDQRLLAAEKEMQARQKAFFLNALSHDLRAPLHNILLNAHLLKLSAKESADVESVQMVMENAVAAGDLVTKLLDFAKVGAEDRNHIESVSVRATLHSVERRFLPVAEQKRLHLRIEGNDDAQVFTDKSKLERIISNLVDNAIKYTQAGGVTLALICRENEVAVRVSDSGMGIPEANVPYLFDEFYQVNNYERDRTKGFGMGLAICKSLARHINADVRLASTSSEGSSFEVVVKTIHPDRGGRPLGEVRDLTAAEDPGLCRV
jgi:signal transduction histidine kinase